MIAVEKAEPDNQIPITRMCELLGVSRSGYHAWVARQGADPGPRARRRAELAVKVVAAHTASDGTYGAPRVLAELRAGGEQVSRKTVARIMADNAIHGISPRTFTPLTTISDGRPCQLPDLVERRFDTGVLNRVWTSDITYLSTGEGWLYLCAVRDGYSRRVLGYAFSDSLHTDLVEDAMRKAVTFRHGDTRGVVFHADRGCQYTSAQLARAAKRFELRLSVGRTGVCFDNSQQESFWSTLKTEFYHRHRFATRQAAMVAVASWIEIVYNRRRRHSALNYLSPIDFENNMTHGRKAA